MEAVFYNYLQIFSLNFLIKKEIKSSFRQKHTQKELFSYIAFGTERQLKWKLSKFIF